MTSFIKKLPAVFQTKTESKFFQATVDQAFSKKDSDLLSGYLGRRTPGSYKPVSDFYIPEPSKNRTWWQLEATSYAKTEESVKTNILFYEDLLEKIDYYGGNTLNQDRLFTSEYYSFGPPIDYDMFINYQNYYWVDQGLQSIEISGVLGTDINGQSSFITPISASPSGLTLSTGMYIKLLDDPVYSTPHIVENKGGELGIQLLVPFHANLIGATIDPLPWDRYTVLPENKILDNTHWDTNTWDSQIIPSINNYGDYITIERGALNNNSWSRSNKWIHIDVINTTCRINNIAFPINATRAMRPIIQFVADLELYKSGSIFRSYINYGFLNIPATPPNLPVRLVDYQNQPLAWINGELGCNLFDQNLVCFFNDTSLISYDMFPWDSDGWDITKSLPVNGYIWQANIMPDNTVNFTPYTLWSTPILEGDIVYVTESTTIDTGVSEGDTWYYSAGIWVKPYNDKVSINQAPLFNLYDHNGINLDNETEYLASTFHGSKVFSYKQNTRHGASVDPVLNFPIVYTSLGQSSDIIFQNNLITDRYTYSVDTPQKNIDGYYYYKVRKAVDLQYPCYYFNNWNLYTSPDTQTTVVSHIPTYSIDAIPLTIYEGETTTITVTTTNVVDGTILYWSAEGIITPGTIEATAANFTDGMMAGYFSIINNIGIITRTATINPILGPDETFVVKIHVGCAVGPVVATTDTITIQDIYSPPEYFTSVLYPMFTSDAFNVNNPNASSSILWDQPFDLATVLNPIPVSADLIETIVYLTYYVPIETITTTVPLIESGTLVTTIVYKIYDNSITEEVTTAVPNIESGTLLVTIEYINYNNWPTENIAAAMPSFISGTLV